MERYVNLECGRCGERLYSDLCDFKESDGSQPHLDREIYTNQAPDTGWWFGTFFIFPIYWECHHPN